MPRIAIERVGKRFGDTVAVDDVTLDVEPGELLVLLGGSGSGKTTLLKTVNRLVEPSEGRVSIDGEDVSGLVPHELRRRIGYCFQKGGLFPHLTVAENVAITPRLLGWAPERIARRVDELLALVALEPAAFRKRLPSELSGGEAQRVAVARALAAGSDVMLLDEPFGALDPLTRDRLQVSFTEIRRQLALTAIFVTHDMLEAVILADRIAVLHRGSLVQTGTAAELFRAPANSYVAELLGTPARQAEAVRELLGDRPSA